jgi:hypothetical protein
MVRRSWTRPASIEETLALWAASLRDIKKRIRPLFKQDRVATNAGLFLESLLRDEQRKTGWMRAEAAGDPGPWRHRPLLAPPQTAGCKGEIGVKHALSPVPPRNFIPGAQGIRGPGRLGQKAVSGLASTVQRVVPARPCFEHWTLRCMKCGHIHEAQVQLVPHDARRDRADD